jgi:hypothetical protein
MLSVGMATGVGVETGEVEISYPALFQRLKGVRSIPTLVQIDSVLDALEYAHAFELHGRQEFERETRQQQMPKELMPKELLSDREIQDLFREVAGTGSISQGDFFDRLHIEAERKLSEFQERGRR